MYFSRRANNAYSVGIIAARVMGLNFLLKLKNVGAFRVANIMAICAAFVILVRHGFGSETRALTIVGLTTVLSLAIVYELVVREVSETALAITLLGLWVAMTATYFGLQRLDPPKKDWHGPLLAASGRTPPNGCDGRRDILSGDYLIMIFGTDGIVGHGSGPFTPVRIGTCPALTFTQSNGRLRIDGFGYDGGDDVVYEIRNNMFHQIIGGYLFAVRNEMNRLDIVDDEGRPTLRVEFLNNHAVQIVGTFRCGGTEPVLVSKSAVQIGKVVTPGHSCRVIGPGGPHGIEYANAGRG